jgi:GTPase
MQRLDAPNPASYIGSGKVAEVVTACGALAIDTVIFDDELSPGQQRNLEKVLGRGVRVADRTALILDIFDQRARSREGRLQVELAATTYQLPRLKRMWTHLERQMGSGAMRAGMGEKQKEIDKRLLRCACHPHNCI